MRTDLGRISTLLQADPDVEGLAAAGSAAAGGADAWSDLDVVIVLRDAAVPRYLQGGWLSPLGTVYAADRSSGPDRCTLRVCLADLRRLDAVLVPASRLGAAAQAPGPLSGARVLFDRSGALAAAVAAAPAGPPPFRREAAEAAFRRLDGELRWNGVLAASRVARGDLLIGAHLALEMLQACLVLDMLLRDRATGTTHHRRGDGRAPHLALPAALSASGVLDAIESALRRWMELAVRWDPGHRADDAPLRAMVEQARRTAAHGVGP